MLPKISIVVPSFNAAQTMERTLESIKNEAYPNLQLICADGASKDGTREVLQRYSDLVDILIYEPDRCQADALNKGFAVADGDIMGWLCADDELSAGALHTVARYFEEHPSVDVVTGGCRRVFDNGEQVETMPGDDFMTSLYLRNTIEQPSTFWRQKVMQKVGPLSEELKYAFDWEYWCRMKRQGFVWDRIPEIFSVYHFYSTNLTSTGGTAIANEMYKIIKEYGPYDGRLAMAYKFLYKAFDLRGFYDQDVIKPRPQQLLFYATLKCLYSIFDQKSINTYNWNFASRQERGKGW